MGGGGQEAALPGPLLQERSTAHLIKRNDRVDRVQKALVAAPVPYFAPEEVPKLTAACQGCHRVRNALLTLSSNGAICLTQRWSPYPPGVVKKNSPKTRMIIRGRFVEVVNSSILPEKFPASRILLLTSTT